MTPTIGHNSNAKVAQRFDDAGPLLDDSREAVFHFVQWHVNDYLAGTAGLSPEQEGVYIRFLMQLYSHGKPLPDDDRWMSTLLRLSIRVWKRVKTELAILGKIVIRNTALTNSRFEQERIKRAEDHQKRVDAAHKRWDKTRSEKASLPKVSTKFGASLNETSSKESKNANENNDSRVKGHMLTNNQNPDSIGREERKKENPAAPSEQVAACGPREEIDGLNGATALIVTKLAGWINPLMPDKRTAKGWLENSVKLFGATVVRDSFAEVEAKAMQGDIIARPIPLLTRICQDKAKRAAPPAQGSFVSKLSPEMQAHAAMIKASAYNR